MSPRIRTALLLGLVLGLGTGCARLALAPFSETAYHYAITLKVEALALIEQADTPYDSLAVSALMQRVEEAYEYARGRPNNTESARQWELLKDPNRNLLGGFVQRWQQQGTLSPVFITEFRGVIADAFDTISGLESGKLKPKDVQENP
jgi:hypothetical protein